MAHHSHTGDGDARVGAVYKQQRRVRVCADVRVCAERRGVWPDVHAAL